MAELTRGGFFAPPPVQYRVRPDPVQNRVKLSLFADYTTYFVKHEAAAKELKKLFNDFAKFSSLRINSDKTEVCGIGVKKVDARALSGFKVVDLTRESTLILGFHHSYNKTLAI